MDNKDKSKTGLVFGFRYYLHIQPMKKYGYLIFFGLIMFGCGRSTSEEDNVKVIGTGGQLVIQAGEQDLLTYVYETVYPPEGVDSLFKRSGFIHPLKTPSGKTLTRIQPEDHYHHYGIWNPWTHVLFEGDTLDFWNLFKGEGTVRFKSIDRIVDEDGYTGFKVTHEYVVLKDGKNKVALQEHQTVRISDVQEGRYTVDFNIEYVPQDSPFKILEYRYGGFGWRTTREWDNQNSTVLTSRGETRKTADGSLAEWTIVQGALGEGSGGAVLMGNPNNVNHPEPIRVWPEDQYGRGDMFICIFPTKYSDWLLEPGNRYTLQYRMVVFDGEYTQQEADQIWQEYSSNY
jgi:hypothetical protein